IKPEFLPHEFELFRQADAGPSRKQGGLGLGLATVRRIVEMQGGTMRAESDGQGAGATCLVELPAAARLTTPAGKSVPSAAALAGRRRALDPARGGSTPALALTAYTRVEDRMKTLSAGYQMHVPKPVEPAELVAVIASLAGRQPAPTPA